MFVFKFAKELQFFRNFLFQVDDIGEFFFITKKKKRAFTFLITCEWEKRVGDSGRPDLKMDIPTHVLSW